MENSRKVVCVSDSKRAGTLEPGLGLTPTALELDSIETVWSHIFLRELKEPENSETVMKNIMELISEPYGSEELNGKASVPNPRVGMSSGTVKSFHPKPKIADSRVYSYDEMIEHQEKLNDSDEFEFDISPVEKNL